MLFINDKATANRVVSLAVNDFIARQRGNAHTVFMQRKVVGVEVHALINRELHFMLTVCQHQATMSIHILNKTGDGIDIHGIRQVTRQAHNNGDISVVAFTGQRERAVHVNHHAGHVFKQVTGNQIVGKLFTRFHWSNGMRTGRANADLKISNTLIIGNTSR